MKITVLQSSHRLADRRQPPHSQGAHRHGIDVVASSVTMPPVLESGRVFETNGIDVVASSVTMPPVLESGRVFETNGIDVVASSVTIPPVLESGSVFETNGIDVVASSVTMPPVLESGRVFETNGIDVVAASVPMPPVLESGRVFETNGIDVVAASVTMPPVLESGRVFETNGVDVVAASVTMSIVVVAGASCAHLLSQPSHSWHFAHEHINTFILRFPMILRRDGSHLEPHNCGRFVRSTSLQFCCQSEHWRHAHIQHFTSHVFFLSLRHPQSRGHDFVHRVFPSAVSSTSAKASWICPPFSSSISSSMPLSISSVPSVTFVRA